MCLLTEADRGPLLRTAVEHMQCITHGVCQTKEERCASTGNSVHDTYVQNADAWQCMHTRADTATLAETD